MDKYMMDLHSDIAPLEGRKEMAQGQIDSERQGLTWEGTYCSVAGELADNASDGERVIRLQGSIYPQNRSTPTDGWIELETSPGQQMPAPIDLYLVGTRPLPQLNITCISRHPINQDYLVAATSDSDLLLLDARLQNNLKVLTQIKLPSSIQSLICCGKQLLGLGKPPGYTVQIIDIITNQSPHPGFKLFGRLSLQVPLIALAENDSCSAWGLTSEGQIYCLQLPHSQLVSQPQPIAARTSIKLLGCLRRPSMTMAIFRYCLKGSYRAGKNKQPFWRHLCWKKRCFLGFAYDGRHYWAFHSNSQKQAAATLLLYNQAGTLIRSFSLQPEVSLSSLNYLHNNLLVLDLEHRQLHQYHLADTMQPVANLPLANHHPGYLPAGTELTAGIHDLCLLYVGGEGTTAVHRYNNHELMPLVGYSTPAGVVKDLFMDGFLLLAQYSPLLNGRSFGVDLDGSPSRQEDWIALFDEYFHPQANLQTLEYCTKLITQQLHTGRGRQVRVVLSIPTPDRRCDDWDNKGFSLATDVNRVKVTHWAIKELLNRWQKAKFQRLVLAGFYYMTEQGSWNDQVLHMFPKLCHKYRTRSFAIPGISSSWVTEFNRAGFDCVALQSSHAFWQPPDRPRYYLLKCAGRIAREFGMGMEVELPYDVLEAKGQQKLRDYLEMAYIQGWAGAFKAYFQSYNLIKALAENKQPECRQLYDDLYQMSRLSRRPNHRIAHISGSALAIDCQSNWLEKKGRICLRLNIEGHQGIFKLSSLSDE